jgi:glycosyltransferase involved in cell wall biosynthesis
MKVKDLISATQWLPGTGYESVDGQCPVISVLLPTFRRGKSGLFRRAVQSVLDQTLKELELIIVDDASTDGTAEQIQEFMVRDGRVSCLRHPKNIGLPAISEYEALLKARGEYIAFQFDDDMFYPNALEGLLKHSRENRGRVCFGHVQMRVREANVSEEYCVNLGQDLATHNLRAWNCLSNNALLLHRDVIRDVGFYDPHIVLTRLCDWDLWRRISEKYLLHKVDVDVGEVDGPATRDSLGSTYSLDAWTSEEWVRTSDNSALIPTALEEYDVFAPRKNATAIAKFSCRQMAEKHVGVRPWLSSGRADSYESERSNCGNILVITAYYDATVSLYFDYLPNDIAGCVRVNLFPGGFDICEIARASCLILVRYFEYYRRWIDAAKLLGVPIYYFLDDNFVELKVAGDDFTLAGLRRNLEGFQGVLVSTRALARYFEQHSIHSHVR